MSKKDEFSAEDEEKIINFVKMNKSLFDVKSKKFHDTEAKNRLWLQLAKELAMDVEEVKKKCQTMLDYLVQSKEKKTTGATCSAAPPLSKSDESLSFLLHQSSLSSFKPAVGHETQSEDSTDNDSSANDLLSIDEAVSKFYIPQRSTPSERSVSDDIDLFFESMAVTVRKFSPRTVARIKLKIGRIVGEEELIWAHEETEKEAAVEYNHLLLQGDKKKSTKR